VDPRRDPDGGAATDYWEVAVGAGGIGRGLEEKNARAHRTHSFSLPFSCSQLEARLSSRAKRGTSSG
jgi:hypothetical protein